MSADHDIVNCNDEMGNLQQRNQCNKDGDHNNNTEHNENKDATGV